MEERSGVGPSQIWALTGPKGPTVQRVVESIGRNYTSSEVAGIGYRVSSVYFEKSFLAAFQCTFILHYL